MGYLLGIDLGAGSGAKIAVADGADSVNIRTKTMPLPKITAGISNEVLYREFLGRLEHELAPTINDVDSIGLVTPGLLKSDGSYHFVSQIPYLVGRNLKRDLESITNKPVAIENDANAGAVAEGAK